MARGTRFSIAVLLLLALFGAGLGLLKAGVYGLTIFVVHPLLIGALASWAFQSESGGAAANHGMTGILIASALLFVTGKEGMVCVLMCLPLTLPLGALGGYFMFRCMRSRAAARGGMAMLLLLPPSSLTFDTHATPEVYTVRTAITIAAPPETVWRHMVAIPDIPSPREWYFRAGIAYPTQARLPGPGGLGAARTCDFSTGRVTEQIDAWIPGRLLRFRVLENPAPMREWSPWGDIQPKHLHGYFVSKEGEFRLTPLPGNRTLLEGTSWYQHGLWPAQYWRVWSDAVVHRIHLRVFRQIQALAEADARS